MRSEGVEFITALQKNPKNIRNICILAHVDHGKTTIADCLISSNGIISERFAGKMRYMDSREDEQKRGITMKSSAISLYHNTKGNNYLVNLIDSPGHVDFSSEVSTAVRLCDGALVVVDVVEGVCPQTHAVLKQAWLEGIKPCLVLNKVDRLITELKLSTQEAYDQLKKVLEQVNAITGTLFSAQVLEQSAKQEAATDAADEDEQENEGDQVFDWSSGLDEADDGNLYFSPTEGNVVFASAVDGWAFSIGQFADMYCQKLGISRRVLMKTLWGDYYLNMKQKKILKGAFAKGKKQLFVQFILDNIWNVYDTVVINRDKEKIDKIVESLKLKISVRDSKQTDVRVHLQAIMRQWLSLSTSLLDMACDELPSPLEMSEERVKNLMSGGFRKFDSFPLTTQSLKEDFLKCCSSDESPVIVFISKMFSVPTDHLPQFKRKPPTKEELALRYEAAKKRLADREEEKKTLGSDDSDKDLNEKKNDLVNGDAAPEEEGVSKAVEDDEPGECFLAFARVYSGTLKKDSTLYVLGPKYQPGDEDEVDNSKTPTERIFDINCETSHKHLSVCTVDDLYVMMGREFDSQDEIQAGNILAIRGLEDHVLKSATVSTSLACPPFTPMTLAAKPIVRVAVEPKQPSQLLKLVAGMKLLNQADPCVQVLVQETGEYVIIAAGEVHLQRCLDDLRERYAKIPINVSEPIVPFRETIVNPPKVDMLNEEISDINKSTAHHSQRLPTFMLKEIQNSTNVQSIDEIDEDGELKFTKTEISEIRKSEKIRDKLGLIESYTANKEYCLHLHAKPIPDEIVTILEENDHLIRIIQDISKEGAQKDKNTAISSLSKTVKEEIQTFYKNLHKTFEQHPKFWKGSIDKIWAIGPKGINNNILINNIKDYSRPSLWEGLVGDDEYSIENNTFREYDNSIITGFQLAVGSGPICEEPMMGVAFFVEDWRHDEITPSVENEDSSTTSSVVPKSYGPLSGQHISAAKEACRRAIMCQPMRLMAAMYSCEIQATSEVLGKVYAVLGKREGKILFEELQEGSDIFHIVAELPVAESFGFAEEIRKRTSGLASPQLVFNRWNILDVDPFWIPTTEEEYELYGEKADSDNQALLYVTNVRRRKGLYVEEKTVQHAEKQRTLKKNK